MKLSKTQRDCLLKMGRHRSLLPLNAKELMYRVNTLYALERDGLTERIERNYMRAYDENVRIGWFLTARGRIALNATGEKR